MSFDPFGYNLDKSRFSRVIIGILTFSHEESDDIVYICVIIVLPLYHNIVSLGEN